jgi:hypothetical protein
MAFMRGFGPPSSLLRRIGAGAGPGANHAAPGQYDQNVVRMRPGTSEWRADNLIMGLCRPASTNGMPVLAVP